MNHKGFSLIEVLVALVILGIGILAIAGMQITSIRGNFFSDNVMQASILGQDRLEELKAIPLNRVTETGIFNEGTFDDGFIAIRGTSFSRRYVVNFHPDTNLVTVVGGTWVRSRVIQVTVSWRDTSDHSVSFSTVKSPQEE